MRKLTRELFICKALEVHGNRYDYNKVVYLNNLSKVVITCPIHGDFKQLPNAHMRGQGCPKCYGRNKSTEEFILEAKLVHGDKYDYSKVQYKTNQTKVCIICPKHGEFWLTPNNHVNHKRGCPVCNLSHGELYIRLLLDNKNIKYISLYPVTVDNNINLTGQAYIDFYIPSKNIAIEYNGLQHYTPIKYFGGKLAYEKQTARDKAVKEYCSKNFINLIIIPYSYDYDAIKVCLEQYL